MSGSAGGGGAVAGPAAADAAAGPVRSPGRPQVVVTIDLAWLRRALGHGLLDSTTALTAAGYPRVEGYWADNPKVDGETAQEWPKRFHGSSDPAVAVHLHVREVGSPGWRWSLLFRDWLRAEPAAREEYTALKREVVSRSLAMEHYAEAKEPWFDGIHERLETWARESGWSPSPERP